jgi:Mce-associated membrane protein
VDLGKTSEETTTAATDAEPADPGNGAQSAADGQTTGLAKPGNGTRAGGEAQPTSDAQAAGEAPPAAQAITPGEVPATEAPPSGEASINSGEAPAALATETHADGETQAPVAGEVAPKKKKKKKKKKAKAPEPQPRQPVPTWRIAVAAAVIVAVIAVAVVGVVQWRRADHLASQKGDRLNAAQTAGTFAEALLTYDSGNPTATLNRLKAMATATYQPKIEQARKDAVTGPTPQANKTTSTAHAENVYLTEVAGQSADAICQTSWVVSSAGQTAPAVEFYLKVGLKKQGGAWKVDNVSGLAAQQPTGTNPPTTNPPTSAPTTTPRPGG